MAQNLMLAIDQQTSRPLNAPVESTIYRHNTHPEDHEHEKLTYPSAQPHAGGLGVVDREEKGPAYSDAPRKAVTGNGSPDSSTDEFNKLVVEEASHDIKFRTLSWQKATLLLFGEYVCLAILALSWSWSVVGWVGGFFITFGLGLLTWCE